jgi:potassium large conductance calcium-activated channel subfamily M alpha protein 1
VDLIIIICLILGKQDFAEDSHIGYYLRGARILRILILFRFENILQKRANEQIRILYELVLTLISIVFISNALILELENNYIRKNSDYEGENKLYKFHDIFYFEIVTLSTVGLGDITPQTDIGRLTIIITIIIAITMIPIVPSKISTVFSLNSKYSRIKYNKYSKTPNHLVLIGNCDPESFDACLEELYHEDHANIDFDTVIMQKKPDENMLNIFNKKSYFNKIYYLVGDVLSHEDLARTKMDKSICAIILANKVTSNHKREDFFNMMKAFSIIKYPKIIKSKRNTRVLLQLILPETKEIYYNTLLQKKDNEQNIQIICLEEIKLQLLGKSCQCQGINTIIAMLITSKKPDMQIKDMYKLDPWMKEYLLGLENEIYCIKIKCELLFNLTFNDLVKIIYELTDFIVIGTDVIHQELKPFVCLNPYNYKFSPFDHFIYLIASRQPNEEEINDLLQEYLENNKKGVIESNAELVKIKRLKKSYWANLDRNFKPKENFKEDENNLEEISSSSLDEENNFFSNNTILNKKRNDFYFTNYHTFISTIRPRTRNECENFDFDILDQHIIICGISENIKHLILPLRTRDKLIHSPILIIHTEEHIAPEILDDIHYFPHVYYMQGNPVKNEDLKKARINKSKAVVILSNYKLDDSIVDADSIFIFKAIKKETKNTLIIADLISSKSIEYLSDISEQEIEDTNFWLYKAFSSGEIYISSMLDTLICQAFYNPYILNIISQLMLGESAFKFPIEISNRLNKLKYIKSSLNLYKINFLLKKFKHSEEEENEEITFKSLFEFLIDKKMIAIAILRFESQSEHKFVFMAPTKDTIINKNFDEIYVISSEDEKNFWDKKYERLNKRLIEQSNSKFTEMCDYTKKNVDEIINNLRNELSVKNVVNITRSSLRKEFYNIYKDKEKEVFKKAQDEFDKE